MDIILSIKAKKPSIPVQKMRDGQIAEVTKSYQNAYNGLIVVRYNHTLYTLGKSSGSSWVRPFSKPEFEMEVRILQPGEQLTLCYQDF